VEGGKKEKGMGEREEKRGGKKEESGFFS